MLAATTAVLFILLYFMCEAIAVAGVLGMVGSNLWYVAGCEIGGGRGWVQVVGLKVGKLILLRLLPTLRPTTTNKKKPPYPPSRRTVSTRHNTQRQEIRQQQDPTRCLRLQKKDTYVILATTQTTYPLHPQLHCQLVPRPPSILPTCAHCLPIPMSVFLHPHHQPQQNTTLKMVPRRPPTFLYPHYNGN